MTNTDVCAPEECSFRVSNQQPVGLKADVLFTTPLCRPSVKLLLTDALI